ncbi:MAG: hypothetical protein DMG24_16740 [Acidobacteria bacterium]|nr:MAG: hypothetical protein DMG24_16740 [Acidobacteriota bacterium]
MGQLLQVRAYESLEELEGLLPAWDELLSHFATATTFSTWQWLVPWWRAYGRDQKLKVLAFFDPRETLVGLAPLASATQRISSGLAFRLIRLLGDGSGDSDNLDLPVLPGYQDEVARALLERLDSRVESWDCCEFNTMPAGSPAAQALLSQLKQRGWKHFLNSRPGSVLFLPESWESYLEKLPRNERVRLPYRLRRLERNYRVRLHKCWAESELPVCLEALFQLHEKRWQAMGRKNRHGSEARRQFYGEIGPLFLRRRWLELWLLELDGKTVAAQFGLRYRDTVFLLDEAFDPAYWVDGVGYVLRGHMLKQLIADGVRRYDFLAGREHFKSRWGAELRTYVNIRFSKPSGRGSFYLRLRQAGESKEWLRVRLPGPAWRLLQWLKWRLLG